MAREDSGQQHTRVDGRRERSARTRLSIIEAYLDLLRRNLQIPTSEEIAGHAGLSTRAVFSHFSDMEALGVAAFDHVLAQRSSTPAGDKLTADRQTRIQFQVEIRARSCEKWLPLWRAVMLGQFKSPEISRRIELVRDLMRARLSSLYQPELSTLTDSERTATLSALETLTDFEGWGRMREHYGLSHADACAAWIKMIDRLLPPTPRKSHPQDTGGALTRPVPSESISSTRLRSGR